MENTIKISKLRKDDLNNRNLIYEFIKDNYGHNFSEEDDDFEIFVGISNPGNIIIGTSILKEYPDDTNKIHLCCICINKIIRNKGYGSKFLNFLKNYHFGKTLTLSVLLTETEVLSFYTKNGAMYDVINTENNTVNMVINNK